MNPPMFPARRARAGLRLLAIGVPLLIMAFVAACGGSDAGAVVDRGPTELPVDARLNGLYWDAPQARLYLTDDGANVVRVWDGDAGFPVFADLPPMQAEQRATLGQITRGADGVLYTTRFGFSAYGAIVAIPGGGAAHDLAGLDVTRRRLGVTPTPDGTLLTGWFLGGAAGNDSGAVSEVTVHADGSAGERDLIRGLNKPTGLVVVGDDLFVADQGQDVLRRYALSELRARATPAQAADGDVVARFDDGEKPDLMTAGDDGTLYIGGGAGNLYAIGAQGERNTLATGWRGGVRGLAWDGAAGRLFAAVMAADDEERPTVRIVPLD